MSKLNPEDWLIVCFRGAPYPAFRMERPPGGIGAALGKIVFSGKSLIKHDDLHVYSARLYDSCDWWNLPTWHPLGTVMSVEAMPDIHGPLHQARVTYLFAHKGDDEFAALFGPTPEE